jgi:pimeloyl-ACP methyl ester carboxylesterase
LSEVVSFWELLGKALHFAASIRSADRAWCRAAAGLVVWVLNAGANAQPLAPLAIDLDDVTVSGVSSGGFMAFQCAVAHSGIVRGVGVIAGDPYYCACLDPVRVFGVCLGGHPDWHDSIGAVDAAVSLGTIDPPSNLERIRHAARAVAACMLHCTDPDRVPAGCKSGPLRR